MGAPPPHPFGYGMQSAGMGMGRNPMASIDSGLGGGKTSRYTAGQSNLPGHLSNLSELGKNSIERYSASDTQSAHNLPKFGGGVDNGSVLSNYNIFGQPNYSSKTSQANAPQAAQSSRSQYSHGRHQRGP